MNGSSSHHNSRVTLGSPFDKVKPALTSFRRQMATLPYEAPQSGFKVHGGGEEPDVTKKLLKRVRESKQAAKIKQAKQRDLQQAYLQSRTSASPRGKEKSFILPRVAPIST